MEEKSGSGSSSITKTCFNATNSFLGIGILTVPYALSRGGWLSLIFFSLIALGTFYTAILLKRCMDIDSSIRSYLDIAERAFGEIGRITVSMIINTELYLLCISLIIMEADNLLKLFPDFTINYGWLIIDRRRTFVLITSLLILPTMLLTDLGILSYVSVTSIFSCLVILVSVVCIGEFCGVGFKAKGELLDLGGLPDSIALYIVCFAGHPVIPTLYISMEEPTQFGKVLLISFFLTTLIYLPMAVAGYLMYGRNLEPQITLSLPTSSIVSRVVIYTTILIPITRYALMITPVAEAIESSILSKKKSVLTQMIIRLLLLITTSIFACLFPHFESWLIIIGSIFVVLGSLLLPSFCYLKISRCYKRCSFELLGIIAIVCCGFLSWGFKAYSSIVGLLSG